MELSELYEITGGDANEVKTRLQSDVLVRELLRMFPSDQNFAVLDAAMADENKEQALKAAQALEKAAGDLGLGGLHEAASKLVNALAHTEAGDPNMLYLDVKEAYEIAVNAIKHL